MMFLTPVIQTSTRIVSDSLCPMHLNALNNSSLGNTIQTDILSAQSPPTYEEAISFTLLKNLQTDYGAKYITRNTLIPNISHSSHIHHQICDPPTHGTSVSQNRDKPTTDDAPIQSLQVNPEISTENTRYSHGSGRLSIISTTSITDYNVHRPPPENNRTKKRSIRHYACVVFTTILALGIPTFIVLMTSGAISGLQHHSANDLKNETKRSTFPMPNSAGVVRRRRESVMEAAQKDLFYPSTDVAVSNQAKSDDLKTALNDYHTPINEIRKLNSQRQKRYHDMMYMINFTRMHSGLHDHKNFIKKLIETIMKNIKT